MTRYLRSPYVFVPALLSFIDMVFLANTGVLHLFPQLLEEHRYGEFVQAFLILNLVLFLFFGLGSWLLRLNSRVFANGFWVLVNAVAGGCLALFFCIMAERGSTQSPLNPWEVPLFNFHFVAFWFIATLGLVMLLNKLILLLHARFNAPGQE